MFFLAQQTFEEYQELGVHDLFSYKLENPFDPSCLRMEGNYFFPYVNYTFEFALWCFVLAALLYWVFARVNSTSFYRDMAYSFGILGILVLLSFHKAFPHPGAVFVATMCIFYIIVNLSCLLAVAAVKKLPYFGVPERYLSNEMEGVVKPYVLYICAALVTIVPYLFLGKFTDYVYALLNGNNVYLISIMACLICLVGVCGNSLIPWVVLEDQPILGGGFMKELPSIFRITGEAKRTEVTIVALSLCVFYVCMLLITKGKIESADIIGIIVIATLGFGIVRAELRKSMLDHANEIVVKKNKGAWN